MDCSYLEPYDLAFPQVMEGIAQGCTVSGVDSWVITHYPSLTSEQRKQLLADSLDDCRSCGIEDEDIDDSWFM